MNDHRNDDHRYYDNGYDDHKTVDHGYDDRLYNDLRSDDNGYSDPDYYYIYNDSYDRDYGHNGRVNSSWEYGDHYHNDSGYRNERYDSRGRADHIYGDRRYDRQDDDDSGYSEYVFDRFEQYEPVSRKKKHHPFRNLIIIVLIISTVIYLFPGGSGISDIIGRVITHDDFATEEPVVETDDPGEFTGETDPSQQAPAPSGIEEAGSIPFYNIRYEILQLDEPLLRNFCAMYEAIAGFEDKCLFPCKMDPDDINLLCELINTECPELFQLDPYKVTYRTNVITGNVVSVNLNYSMTKEEYDNYYQQCCGVIWNIMTSAEGKSDYEKELCAYRYIIENCVYDDSAPNCGNAAGTLVDGHAKCEGISKAMKWILENMNIMCLCPFGDSVNGTAGHMWNTVRLNGAFYDVDVTADTSRPDENRTPLYGAVNVSDSWIRSMYDMNGYASKRMNIPGYAGMDESFHALNGRFVYSGESYETVLYRLMHEIYAQGGGTFFIQFEDPAAFNEFITAAGSSEQIVSWFNSAGCRSRGFHSEMNYSNTYNICCLTFTFR